MYLGNVNYQIINILSRILFLQKLDKSQGYYQTGATVKVMHRCVGWFGPSRSDEIDYKSEDIMENDISYPVPVNRRGTYKFPCSVEKLIII